MYYLGFDFDEKKFCVTTDEKKAVSFTVAVKSKVITTNVSTPFSESVDIFVREFNKLSLTDDMIHYTNDKVTLKISKCKKCGRPFVTYDTEIDFFEKKGLPLPRRCYDCRQHRKVGNK